MESPSTDAPAGPQRKQTAPCSCPPHRHDLDESTVAGDVALLTALGNATRYEILRIVAASDDDLCVCQIEPALEVSQGAVSQALARLVDAGLLERHKAGRWRYYGTTDRAEAILAVLDETRGQP